MFPQKKKTICFSIDRDIVKKLKTIHMVDRIFFDHKETTLSGIVEKALTEYFENHKEEINKMMDDYHEQGGCANL